MAAEHFEDFLSQFGNPGRCQVLSSLIIVLIFMQWGLEQQFNIVMSYIPDHHCKISKNWNLSKDEFVPEDQCSMYPTDNSSAIPCSNGYEYITLKGEIYPSNEFDLVCDREYLFRLMLTIPAIGVMLGGLIFGPLSDKYGRKRILALLTPIFGGLFIGQTFSPNLFTFIAFRFCEGFVAQGIQTNCITYLAELFRRKMRTYVNLFLSCITACTLVVQMYGMYFLMDWRFEQFVVGSVMLPTAIIVWFLPESVSWLLSKGRVEDCEKILRKYAKCNKLTISSRVYEELETYSEEFRQKVTASESIFTQGKQLFTNSILRRFILSIMYTLFTTSCAFNAFSFSIATLDGNIYTNYLINGGGQICVTAVSVITFSKFGRVAVLFTHFIISGLLGAAAYILSYYYGGDNVYQIFITLIAIFARNLTLTSLVMLITYSSELMPTPLRSTAIGLGFMSNRLGSVVTPQILFTLNHIWQPLPQTIFGVLCIIAAFVIFFLPETFHRQLPNSIEDVEKFVSKENEPTENTPLVSENIKK